MASKTGWYIAAKPDFILDYVPDCGRTEDEDPRRLRVCVRVDDVPEKMTRAEFMKAVRVGWQMRINAEIEPVFVVGVSSDTLGVWTYHGVSGRDYFQRVGGIHSARPHDEAPWIEIVD